MYVHMHVPLDSLLATCLPQAPGHLAYPCVGWWKVIHSSGSLKTHSPGTPYVLWIFLGIFHLVPALMTLASSSYWGLITGWA